MVISHCVLGRIVWLHNEGVCSCVFFHFVEWIAPFGCAAILFRLMMDTRLGVKIIGPARFVTSCTDTSHVDNSGVTRADTVMELLIRRFVLCVDLHS